MSRPQVKPQYNAKRRIQFLFAFCVFLVVAATAGWYFVASLIDDASDRAIAQQARQGVDIACPNKEVRGYPFRFGIFCDALEIKDSNAFVQVNTGALRTAAQFYDPFRQVVELDGPATITLPSAQTIRADWDQMRATTRVARPIPTSGSIVGEGLTINANRAGLRAEQLEAHMRVVNNDLDIAGRGQDVSAQTGIPQIDALPPLGFDFDIRINDGAVKAEDGTLTLRGSTGTIQRIALLITNDAGVLLSGQFAVNDQGLLDGELTLRIIDIDRVMQLASEAMPDLKPTFEAYVAGQHRSGEQGDEVSLKLTIEQSQIRLGFIPLGKITPL